MSRQTGLGIAVAIGSFVTLAITVAGIVYAMGTHRGEQNFKIQNLNCQIEDHESRLRLLEKTIAEQRPIWRAIANKLGISLNNDSLR